MLVGPPSSSIWNEKEKKEEEEEADEEDMHFGFYVFGFQAHTVEEYMSLSAAILVSLPFLSPGWLVLLVTMPPRVRFHSGVAKPRMLCILACVEQKDCCSGMYQAGIDGDIALHAVFSSLVALVMQVHFLVVVQRPFLMVMPVWQIMEISQLQYAPGGQCSCCAGQASLVKLAQVVLVGPCTEEHGQG